LTDSGSLSEDLVSPLFSGSGVDLQFSRAD